MKLIINFGESAILGVVAARLVPLSSFMRTEIERVAAARLRPVALAPVCRGGTVRIFPKLEIFNATD